MKKFRKIIIIILLIIIILAVYFIFRNLNKTIYNDDYVQGNTGGNLLNGGLFCEDKDKIYFSNQNDDGMLYEMNLDCTKFKKVPIDDKVKYINSVGPYLYFTRNNNTKEKSKGSVLDFYTTGVYRLSKKSSRIIRLYSDPSGIINIWGNYVYYQHYNAKEGLKFYKVKIDQSDETKLSDEAISPASIQNGVMYYAGITFDHSIHALDLTTQTDSVVYEGNCFNCIADGDYIYYMSQDDNYSIYRIDLDGNNPTKLVNERVSTYNLSVTGKYLYYQTDGGDNNGISRMNLETKEVTRLMDGDFKNINITSDHVFFQDYHSNQTYTVPVGENNNVGLFNPPASK